ncbi:hypothetical protein Pint_21145 [Pistacia integerrima]|uniref:Uncharacterized protein n=1 Tax=Pistacia integerrima TaxID=434235 RepID=A0ACC0XB19_9ROSI|nr:hypothetical protein Pint_21145 [Pistacia integerrima]
MCHHIKGLELFDQKLCRLPDAGALKKLFLADYMEQQCNGKTLEYSPSWFKRSAVSIILHTKWLETIQILPVEAKLSSWRSPSYNLTRLLHTFVASLIFGVVYWNQGQELNNQQNIFNILGSMCGTVIFFGASNCLSVLLYVTTEKTVSYRERFAGMYSSWTYALAQVVIEIPYVLIQTIMFVVITYSMIGYYVSAYKICWYFDVMLCTLLYYTYLGMMLTALTPSFIVATILSSASFSMFNLFSGFFIRTFQGGGFGSIT